ncbi:MOSC domain-containing protein [Streptomyces desertarenae]|uniref:MOSC domain-containing protein n=1 Tax=Streptomyces desertarenae TaxID=2666184 RepID=A0ABW4PMR4_9ACTN
MFSSRSLDALNRRTEAGGGRRLPLARFRPGTVIDGRDESPREDRIRRMGVGNAELGCAEPAVRCAVTMVGQRSGAGTGPEPLRPHAAHRGAAEDGSPSVASSPCRGPASRLWTTG